MMILLLVAAFCFNLDQVQTKASAQIESESIFLDLSKEIKEKYEGSEQKEQESELKLGSKTRVLVELNSRTDDTGTCHNAEGGEVKRKEEDKRKAEEKAFSAMMMTPTGAGISKATGTETRGTGTTETGSKSKNRSEEPKFEGQAKFKFERKADVRATVQIDKSGVYHIQDSGIGNSWLIGTDVFGDVPEDYANGFVEGIDGCPPVLAIPGILSDSEGNTKPVEIIGQGAFVFCGCDASCSIKGKTKILKVPHQVKVIKYAGLGSMEDLESFEIEAGSGLETIEDYSLYCIGQTTGQTPSKRTGTLILPSTLSSVYDNGIAWCNLFHTIIYCGNHSLTNSSELEYYTLTDTVVKVTSRYPPGSQIFKRNPSRTTETEAEAERLCQDFLVPPTPFPTPNPTPSSTPNPTPNPSPTTNPTPSPKPVFQRGCTPLLATTRHLLSFFSPLIPTDTLPSLSLRRWSPSFFFFIPFG